MTFYGIESGYLSEPLLYEIGDKLDEVVISSLVRIEFLLVTGPVRNLVREKFRASMYKERAILRESGQMFYFNGGNNGK